jgi:hypothetical protein
MIAVIGVCRKLFVSWGVIEWSLGDGQRPPIKLCQDFYSSKNYFCQQKLQAATVLKEIYCPPAGLEDKETE